MRKTVCIIAIFIYALSTFCQQNNKKFADPAIETEESVAHKSEQYYQKETELNSENYVAYYNLGLFYATKYQFDYAEKNYNKVIQLEPKFKLAYSRLASLLLLSGQMENAGIACEKALQMDTLSALNYLNLGIYKFYQIQFEEAENYFIKSISLDSMNFQSFLNYGTLLQQIDRKPEAIIQLKKAIQLNPKDVGSSYSLASIYGSLNQTEEAYKCLEIALINGISFYDMLQVDVSLASLREDKIQWKALMKKYFPNKGKK
ncbi:MAG: hypothetical protein ABI851_04380 [Saprospiraceae bacterium]